MMQDTPTDLDSEFSTGKHLISWKSAEDLSASTTESGPTDREAKTKNLQIGEILQLCDSADSFHRVNFSIMQSRANSTEPNTQSMLTSTPITLNDSPTPSTQSAGADISRPSTLSVDAKLTPNNDHISSLKLSPLQVQRYHSGESSDERVDKKLKSRQSSNEGSFERSISLRDTAQEQTQSKKMDLLTTSDSCKSYDSLRSEMVSSMMPPSVKEKDKKESKSDKKGRKAWYNFINPTYKSRSEELKRLFKDLPPDERLIVDYSCALQKDILVHGRLYVTQNFFCFYSKIFGWETCEYIKCKEIISVAKGKTALVIPNALQINTKTDKHFLTTFTSRDKTYMILFRCWQNALIGQQMSSTELWQYVHACYGEELGLTSDDDDYVAPSTEDDAKGSTATITDNGAPRLAPKTAQTNSFEEFRTNYAALQKFDINSSPKKVLVKGSPHRVTQSAILKKFDNVNDIQTDSSDACDSDLDREKLTVPSIDVTCPNCITHHVGREMLNKVYLLPIDELFTLLFTNSKFMLDLHTNRKTTAVQCTNWHSDEDTNQKIRQVTYTMALPTNSLGPKVSHVTETQVMASHSIPGEIYSIDAEACNGGIPYADSFFVSTHWCLTREASHETRLSVWTQVKYKKNLWGFMKSLIDKNSYNGVDNMLVDLNCALLTEVNRTQQKGTRRRRRRLGSKGGDLNDGLYKNGSTEHSGDLIPQYQNRKTESPDALQSVRRNDRTFYATLLVLLLLLIMNILLYYRLNSLETKVSNSAPQGMDSSLLRIGQAGEEGVIHEWVHLLQQQENIHAVETSRWKDSVLDAADHLKRAEESLRSLLISIPSQQRTKIQSLLHHLHKLKESKINTLSEENNDPPPIEASNL